MLEEKNNKPLIKVALILAILDLVLLVFVFSQVQKLGKEIKNIGINQQVIVKKEVKKEEVKEEKMTPEVKVEEKIKIVKERIPEKYTEVNLNISKWLTFKDPEGRFEFKYPDDYHYKSNFTGEWDLKENQLAIFRFIPKKYPLQGADYGIGINLYNKNFDIDKYLRKREENKNIGQINLLILNDKYRGIESMYGKQETGMNTRETVLSYGDYTLFFGLSPAEVINKDIFYQILDTFKFLK